MNQYFDRIDVLGNEAEDVAAELPTECTLDEITDGGLQPKIDRYMQLLDWIDALRQETIRGKNLDF